MIFRLLPNLQASVKANVQRRSLFFCLYPDLSFSEKMKQCRFWFLRCSENLPLRIESFHPKQTKNKDCHVIFFRENVIWLEIQTEEFQHLFDPLQRQKLQKCVLIFVSRFYIDIESNWKKTTQTNILVFPDKCSTYLIFMCSILYQTVSKDNFYLNISKDGI